MPCPKPLASSGNFFAPNISNINRAIITISQPPGIAANEILNCNIKSPFTNLCKLSKISEKIIRSGKTNYTAKVESQFHAKLQSNHD